MDAGLQALDGALAIGRQADPFAAEQVQARLDAARSKARADEANTSTLVVGSAPASASAILSKVKSWFAVKEDA
jgi:hypothetical protein